MPASDPENLGGKDNKPRDSNGWDGKLRVEKKAVLANPEALSDPEYSDPEAPPQEPIEADEDLLEGYEPDTEDIDLVHCRISSIPALHLERFPNVERLCLRQNAISHVELPETFSAKLKELDLYDNVISHVRGFDSLGENVRTLDLSFNKIKHIKNISHLKGLKDLYFVQNKIGKIEGLEGLDKLRMVELAANRIREIENLETLTSLEELWLGKNKITELKGLSTLSNLRLLSLQSNRLPTIPSAALSSLPNLAELYISHNLLTSISGLESNTSLRVLDVSSNKISHLENISHLTMLEELWASDNDLESFEEVERECKGMKALETVYFEGNPLERRGPVVYRGKVRMAVPQVKQIDATYVRS